MRAGTNHLLSLLVARNWCPVVAHLSYFTYLLAHGDGNVWLQHKMKKKRGGGVVHTCRQCVPVMISPHERKLISACVRHMNTVTHWLICPLMILSIEGTSHVSPHRNGYENRHGAHCWGKTINHNPFSYTRIWMSGHHWLLVLNLN